MPSKQITIDGVLYPSIKTAARKFGVSSWVIVQRINAGELGAVSKKVAPIGVYKSVKGNIERYTSVKQCAEANGLTIWQVKCRALNGLGGYYFPAETPKVCNRASAQERDKGRKR